MTLTRSSNSMFSVSKTQEAPVEAVVDTGFTDFLALPFSQIENLGLPLRGVSEVGLADGSRRQVEEYTGIAVWDGIEQLVIVQRLEEEVQPLVGMGLLRGFNLSVDAVPGGAVRIARLTPAGGAAA